MLLAGCAAKPTARSAQEDKDRAACLEEPLKKESYDEHQKSFASCMTARGYHEDKLYPSETTANARNPLISDGLKNVARESSPELAASERYERAVADYNSCVLEHTSNLSACAKQQAIMNGLGKVSSRLSLGQSYQTTPRISQTTNTAGITQGANTANTTQATFAPPTTSSLPAQISPPARETVVDHPERVDAPLSDRPIPF
jgi:hypothetical protein